MEVSHKPGNLSCSEVRELLSDIIDARHGELPHPDGTRLAEPGMRAAAELHLAACDSCREELWVMQETGAAFADYAVGEPPVQHFANYGAVVRERMACSDPKAKSEFKDRRHSRVRSVLMFSVSALIAASLAFAITSGWAASLFHRKIEVAKKHDKLPVLKRLDPPVDGVTPVTVIVPNQSHLEQRVFAHNPKEPAALKRLQKDEWDYGYLVLGEKTAPNERPLFGVYLRTTRDVDRETLGLMVYHVVPGSPAAAMGLQDNDYIVTVNGEAVNNGGVEEAVKFIAGIRNAGAGTPLKLHIVRPVNGQHLFMEKQGTLGEYAYESALSTEQ